MHGIGLGKRNYLSTSKENSNVTSCIFLQQIFLLLEANNWDERGSKFGYNLKVSEEHRGNTRQNRNGRHLYLMRGMKGQLCCDLDRNFWSAKDLCVVLKLHDWANLPTWKGLLLVTRDTVFSIYFYLFLFSPWNVLPEVLCVPLHPYPLQDREQVISTFLKEDGKFLKQVQFWSPFHPFSS